MRVHFTDNGWDDYLYWCRNDSKVHERVNDLIENARKTPFTGLGKPEPLKGKNELKGFWSRRITGEHRLVYVVEGKGAAQCIILNPAVGLDRSPFDASVCNLRYQFRPG